MPKYTITYFPARGRAEAARLAFAYGDIDFEDRRLPGAVLFAGREDGTIKAPFKQFPVLEVDGEAIGQSASILRFAAKVAGLYPEDPVVAAKAESILDQIGDITNGLLTAFFHPVEAEKPALLAKAAEKLPRQFEGLVAIAGDKDTFLGTVTFADIALFASVEGFQTRGFDLLEHAPSLKKIVDHIGSHPRLAKYFEKRAQVEKEEAERAKAAAAK